MISTVQTYAVDLTHILFGNILGVSPSDLLIIAVLGVIVIATIVLLYKEFLVVSFDRVLAATLRLPVEVLRNLMLILIALTIVVSLQAVGVGLVAAMLVTPAATAYLLTRRLPMMMVSAALIGAFSGVAGLYLSYYLNIASGAAVVLVATAVFVLAYVFAPRRGLLANALAARR
jgi:manganese/iron transport system permease protein